MRNKEQRTLNFAEYSFHFISRFNLRKGLRENSAHCSSRADTDKWESNPLSSGYLNMAAEDTPPLISAQD